jgi:lysozyme
MTIKEKFDTWFLSQNFRNFSPDELTWYFSKVRNGVKNNYPPEGLWPNIVPTLRVLDLVREHFDRPLNISSTYRALPYNRTIGSPDGSLHVQFKAADFTVRGISPTAVFKYIDSLRRSGKVIGGLGKYSTFVHFDTRGRNSTW